MNQAESGEAMTRPRIYVAHPMASYGTEHERDCLASLAGLLPGADLYDPAGRYMTDAGWLRAWPRVLASLSGLVVFGAEDGTVGTGCLRELTDAIAAYVPVAALVGDELHEIDGFQLLAPPWRSARNAGHLIVGRAMEIGDFPGAAYAPTVEWRAS